MLIDDLPASLLVNHGLILFFLLTWSNHYLAELFSFMVDIIMQRMSLQSDKITVGIRAFEFGSEIWRKGGVLGFYSGLSPAVLRHLFYTPIRIVSYEHLRVAAAPDEAMVGKKELVIGISDMLKNTESEYQKKYFDIHCTEILASPADLIKVRMQADGHLLSTANQPRYAGLFDAFRKIIQKEGFPGLWRGVFPNAQRAFLVNMGELTCYDQAKHFIIRQGICQDNTYAHSLASVASGLCSTALSCPADVVKTRMMNQTSGRDADVYRNSVDCLYKTVKFEGMRALWKGFFPTWARLGPWQFVFWVSYEKLRQVSGLSSF
ncbi:hypothetical protein C4D60_Mb06t31200 [Musa balbisiana]|uniref:Mitochondrial uncoupling protein 3 n=1 Tax=Musa balbisiana TaxID=52838 RepID=A0A4S8IUG8_MUSBA|nr:hypothetical protein C4D60_Mb06t31200 [Musa balbisiana]